MCVMLSQDIFIYSMHIWFSKWIIYWKADYCLTWNHQLTYSNNCPLGIVQDTFCYLLHGKCKKTKTTNEFKINYEHKKKNQHTNKIKQNYYNDGGGYLAAFEFSMAQTLNDRFAE